MSNTIHNYPKSSANAYRCEDNKYNINLNGTPSSMSVPNGQFPKALECYDTLHIGYNTQSRQEKGFSILNEKNFSNGYSPDFRSIECDGPRGCNAGKKYISGDPRLVDPRRAGALQLDRPPISSSMKLKDLSVDKSLNNYGQNYATYSDINAGQIVYYVDKSIQDPYYSPNFPTTTKVNASLYQDPMGSLTPQYDRVVDYDNHINSMKSNETELNSIADTNAFREDLMERQMSRINEQKWSSRWGTEWKK